MNELLQKFISEGNDIFKPGYLRLNLPYFYPEYVINYVIDAIKFICENGHLFLGLYYYDIKNGRFYHYRNKNKEIELSLNLFDFSSDLPQKEDLYNYKNSKKLSEPELEKIFNDVKKYTNVRNFLNETFGIKNNQIRSRRTDYQPFGESENARWFCVYQDVKELLRRLNYCEVNVMNVNNDEIYNGLIADFERKMNERKERETICVQKKERGKKRGTQELEEKLATHFLTHFLLESLKVLIDGGNSKKDTSSRADCTKHISSD